jgi:hypothetical protein
MLTMSFRVSSVAVCVLINCSPLTSISLGVDSVGFLDLFLGLVSVVGISDVLY